MLDQITAELKTLPSRLDDYIESPRPWLRSGRIHPMTVRDLVFDHASPTVAILFIASLFRDVMPWVYELGVEVIRHSKARRNPVLQSAVRDLQQAIEMALHSPLQEILERNRESRFLMEGIDPELSRALNSILAKATPPTRKAATRKKAAAHSLVTTE